MSWKLLLGVFFLFTGVLSILGIGLILLHMLDEYKKVRKADNKKETPCDIKYISEDVVEEFR